MDIDLNNLIASVGGVGYVTARLAFVLVGLLLVSAVAGWLIRRRK